MINGKASELQKDSKAQKRILRSGRQLTKTYCWGQELNWSAYPGQLKNLWGEPASEQIISRSSVTEGNDQQFLKANTKKKIFFVWTQENIFPLSQVQWKYITMEFKRKSA
jgi:hypothetical protein